MGIVGSKVFRAGRQTAVPLGERTRLTGAAERT